MLTNRFAIVEGSDKPENLYEIWDFRNLQRFNPLHLGFPDWDSKISFGIPRFHCYSKISLGFEDFIGIRRFLKILVRFTQISRIFQGQYDRILA